MGADYNTQRHGVERGQAPSRRASCSPSEAQRLCGGAGRAGLGCHLAGERSSYHLQGLAAGKFLQGAAQFAHQVRSLQLSMC